MLETLIKEKKKKRKKVAASTPIPEVPDNTSEIPEEYHEYSDEEEDMDESIMGVNTLLDVLDSTRVGLYSNDIEPPMKVVRDDTAHANKIDLDNMQWTRCDFSDVKDDPLALNRQTKASSEALGARQNPLSIFLLLAPHSLWEHVARCSEMKRRVLLKKMSSKEGRKDMKYMNSPIVPQKVFSFVCVLILNMLQPYAGGMSGHWRTDVRLLRRPGLMGLIMPRDEFRCMSRCLCFYDPEQLQTNDKFTKIRYVLDTINSCFKKTIHLGPWVSFDEATISTRSSMTPARQYNPFKPHKFGWKLFMLCCSVIGYCYSFEVYQGKLRSENISNDEEEHKEEASEADDPVADAMTEEQSTRLDDTTTGPLALLRNCAWMSGSHRTVFCDRYYTSVGMFI